MTQSEGENHYIYRPSHGEEADIARLVEQSRILVSVIKLFPKHFKPRGDEFIVDIGCGPGGWAIDVAFKYQDMSVIGIDIAQNAVDYAMLRAKMEAIDNVTFEQGDATKHLPFRDESVDYINMTLANSFLLKEQWPLLLAECARVLHPGGWIRSVEWVVTHTSSPALRRVVQILNEAIASSGKRYVELVPYLRPMMKDASLVPAPLATHVVDFSESTSAHRAMCEDIAIGVHLATPFVVSSGITSREEFEQLIERMKMEMREMTFYAQIHVSDITAQKLA